MRLYLDQILLSNIIIFWIFVSLNYTYKADISIKTVNKLFYFNNAHLLYIDIVDF